MFKRLLIAIALLAGLVFPLNAQAVEDFSCLNFKVINEKGLWSLSEGPEVTTAVVTWSVQDPGNCVIGKPTGAWVNGDQVEVGWTSVNYIRGKFYGTLSSARSGENYVVIMKFDIPNTWISSVANMPGTWGGIEMSHQKYYQLGGGGGLWTSLTLEAKASSSQKQSKTLRAELAAATLWGLVLSNRQKLVRDDCTPESVKSWWGESSATSEVKVITAGQRPKISIEISDPSNCAFLIYTPAIGTSKQDTVLNPFWSSKGSAYWSNLVSTKPDLIQVSANVFGEKRDRSLWPNGFEIRSDAVPIGSTSSLSLVNNKIVINSELDLTQLNKSLNKNSEVQIVIGIYSRINTISSGSGSSGGWRVTWVSSNSFRMSYSRGGATPTGIFDDYQVASVKVPIIDLLEDRETREKAKTEAEAKVVAELKVKQGADLEKCLKINEVSEILRSQIEAYKYKFPGNSEFSRLISAIPPALYCNDAFRSSAFGGQIISLEISLGFIDSEFTAAVKRATSSTQKTTITCTKGKLTKKITAIKPVCPSGYKKK